MLPQILILIIHTVIVTIILVNKDRKQSFISTFIAALIVQGSYLSILYWGGFFDILFK